MAKVYFHTLGCRLNQAESEKIAKEFEFSGHEIVKNPLLADIKIINTCTVTQSAARKSTRSALPSHKLQRVVVTGCHSHVRPNDFSRADLVVENTRKMDLASICMEKFGMEGYSLGMDYRSQRRLALYPLSSGHTRAFVKIQDGCNLQCTFCMTTLARGPSLSRCSKDILQEIRTLVDQGCQEVVLTGVHAGAYLDLPNVDLGKLIELILNNTQISRLRLSSLEPWNFKNHWLSLWSRYPKRLCRHLHMSIQSGSDNVLARMQRAYHSQSYARKVEALRESIPGVALTTDIIVGFPEETRKEHAESLAFISQMQFADAHIFTYSSRPGTKAATMNGQIPTEIKHQRYHEMKTLTDKSKQVFLLKHVGCIEPVLWEFKDKNNCLSGLTDTYIRVATKNHSALRNTIMRTHLTSVEGVHMCGEPVTNSLIKTKLKRA